MDTVMGVSKLRCDENHVLDDQVLDVFDMVPLIIGLGLTRNSTP